MSSFLHLPLDSPKSVSLSVTLPKERGDLEKPLQGRLRYNPSGYIYNEQLKSVLWLKFLALGVFIPLQTCARKCVHVYKRAFFYDVPSKRTQEARHRKQLASIAWKAVVTGWYGKSLYDSMERFALAEMNYNHGNTFRVMEKARSDRLQGFYFAPCMHPLFHQSQYQSKADLAQIPDSIERYRQEVLAVRCEKYAAYAILRQNCCAEIKMISSEKGKSLSAYSDAMRF